MTTLNIGKYTKARSDFVKEEIKKTKWKDRKYINELLWHEYCVYICNLFGHIVLSLRPGEEYFQEGKKIWKELRPKEFELLEKLNNLQLKTEKIERRKREFDRKKNAAKYLKEEKQDLKEEKRQWKEMGGLN